MSALCEKRLTIIKKMMFSIPLLFIFAIFVLHLALPDKTYSKEERRYLTQWPAFHADRLLNGSYETKVEAYFSDQFPFRNFWVGIQKGSEYRLLTR